MRRRAARSGSAVTHSINASLCAARDRRALGSNARLSDNSIDRLPSLPQTFLGVSYEPLGDRLNTM
jgi:hypothetical protein